MLHTAREEMGQTCVSLAKTLSGNVEVTLTERGAEGGKSVLQGGFDSSYAIVPGRSYLGFAAGSAKNPSLIEQNSV